MKSVIIENYKYLETAAYWVKKVGMEQVGSLEHYNLRSPLIAYRFAASDAAKN